MNAKHERLLPHELFFGLFLLVTWGRLVMAAGFFGVDALVYLACLLINGAVILYARARDTDLRWRLRLLFYPIVINVLFPQMKGAIPKLHPGRMDELLQRMDGALIGRNLSLRLEPLVHPVLTELFSLCYILFFPYLLFSLIYYFRDDLAVLKKFVAGLFTIYGLGFLGYTWVPAAGPYVAMADRFSVPLTGGWITQWNAAMVKVGSNGVDVFPSLHCAVSAYFLFFDRRHRPWRFRFYVVPCVGLWLSTIYLRYHYFIDVLCGFALAAFGLWVAKRFGLRPEASTEPATTFEGAPSSLSMNWRRKRRTSNAQRSTSKAAWEQALRLRGWTLSVGRSTLNLQLREPILWEPTGPRVHGLDSRASVADVVSS